MIIQMNATVCADVDHGDNGQHKIAGSDQCRRAQGGRRRGSDRENKKFKGALQKCRFSQAITGTMPRVPPFAARMPEALRALGLP